jgi:MFS family permease
VSSVFLSLRVRNYRLFASGQLVSNTGSWMQRTAQDWLVLQLSGNSGVALGIVTGLQFLPVLFFGLYGGMLADRYDKRTLLTITQSAMGLLALLLGVLDLSGVVTIWQRCSGWRRLLTTPFVNPSSTRWSANKKCPMLSVSTPRHSTWGG